MSAALALVEEEDDEQVYAGEFDADFQTKITALVLRDTVFLNRTDGLIDPRHFEQEIDGAIVSTIMNFYATFKKAPDRGSLGVVFKDAITARKIRTDLLKDLKPRLATLLTTDISDRDLVIDKVADFAKNRALENAILQSVNLIQKKDYAAVKKLVDGALLVGASDAMGAVDYWSDDAITQRTAERRAAMTATIKHDGITTGCADLDKELYHHGWGRKELSAILGAAKAGKSMAMWDFGKNASLAGYNVLGVTLEVGKKIITDRCDAAVSDIMLKVVKDHPNDVEKKLRAVAGKAGKFIIHEFASGTLKCSQLRRLVEYYRSRGVMFDLIVVDYADIMCPETRRNETRDELNAIYLDLRAIAFDNNAAVLTGTQTNREGAKGVVARATDVAEDFNKARTVDLMLSINATNDEKSTGEARIYFALNRNGEDGITLRIKQDRSRMQFLKSVIGKE